MSPMLLGVCIGAIIMLVGITVGYAIGGGNVWFEDFDEEDLW